MNIFKINNKNIGMADIIPLITGKGLPYKFNNKIAYVSMKEFNCLNCIYEDGTIHVYKKPNGLKSFLKDIEHDQNNFEWINENKEIQLDLLYLMPRFHGDLLKTYKKRLNSALNLNDEDSLFEVIPSDLYRELRLLNELLKKKNESSYDLLNYYYQQIKTIEI